MSKIDNELKARKVLPELIQMIDSDLMKASHYLKKAATVALVADDTKLATRIATYHVELENFEERFRRNLMTSTPKPSKER
ncbi:MAG TPA: hypothetical protein VNG32_00455 [Candidatus Dormibacteraeota bacterium]|nr:hypothetical protein [Candidatus Dormibacteraeota bacterium]